MVVHTSIEMLNAVNTENEMLSVSLKLTPRGAEVFSLIIKGLSDKRIGEMLGISYSGVRRHKEKMLLANGCVTILELISRYYENCCKP